MDTAPAVLIALQKILSSFLCRDAYFGMEEKIEEQRPPCPGKKRCERLAIRESKETAPYRRLHIQPPNSVTEQTKKAAVDAASRRQAFGDGFVGNVVNIELF